VESVLERADIVLTSGGNTLFAVDRWKMFGIDAALRRFVVVALSLLLLVLPVGVVPPTLPLMISPFLSTTALFPHPPPPTTGTQR
jgi:hypothetical protein